jgi:hypothetical protein
VQGQLLLALEVGGTAVAIGLQHRFRQAPINNNTASLEGWASLNALLIQHQSSAATKQVSTSGDQAPFWFKAFVLFPQSFCHPFTSPHLLSQNGCI